MLRLLLFRLDCLCIYYSLTYKVVIFHGHVALSITIPSTENHTEVQWPVVLYFFNDTIAYLGDLNTRESQVGFNTSSSSILADLISPTESMKLTIRLRNMISVTNSFRIIKVPVPFSSPKDNFFTVIG